MAILEKDKSWSGRVRISGHPVRKKRGFITKAAAEKWERAVKGQIKNPSPEAPIPLTFSEASTRYIEHFSKRHEKNTYRQKAFIIRGLIKSMGEDPYLIDVTKNKIIEYLDKRYHKIGGKSANRDLRELRTIFNWFRMNIEGFQFEQNPTRGIEKYSENEFVRYVPPPEDINKVFLVAENEYSLFLKIIYFTLAREIEVMRLQWERDIDLKSKAMLLWTKKRKGQSMQSDVIVIPKPLHIDLETAYKKRNKQSPYVFCNENGDQWSRNKWSSAMPRLCKKAGVKPFGYHAIRHYGARLLAENGLSIREIQEQLRHRRASTTDFYLKGLVARNNRAASILEENAVNIMPETVSKIVP